MIQDGQKIFKLSILRLKRSNNRYTKSKIEEDIMIA